MTATDELRRLLTEAGVEWVNTRNDGSKSDYFTEWQFDGIEGHAIATEWAVGHLTVCIAHPMSPEQAIAATLGPCSDSYSCTNSGRTNETCHRELRKNGWGTVTEHCSECGADLGCDTRNKQNFCPNCGRRIEVDDG